MLERLAKQTALYGISTILGRFLSYLLTPLYTRVFCRDDYGIITDIYALIPFALVVLTLGMESGYFRFAAKTEAAGVDTAAAKRRLFATTWGATSLAALAFFVAVAAFRTPVAALMGDAYTAHPSYVVIVAAIVMLDVCACIPFSRLREEGRAGVFVTLKLLNIVLQTLFAIVFWFAGLFNTEFGVGWAFVANLAAGAATTAAVVAVAGGTLPRIDRRVFAAVFAYSLPLLLSGIAGTANEFIDRQMIKHLVPHAPMEQLGVYGAITKIAVVMTLFTQMYRLAAEPFFLSNFKREDFVAMNAAALKYFIMFSMAIFLGIALYRDIFALIVGAQFREGIFILPVVLGANILSGVWLNLSFWYKREEKTRYALWVTLSGLLFSVAGGMVLIPLAGYCGAAWSRLLSEAAMVAVSLVLNRICFPTPYDFRRIGEYILLGLALFAASEVLGRECGTALRYTLNTLLFVFYTAYAVRRERIDVAAMLRAVFRQG